ncbi:acetyl-CoA acetyltransferase [Pseudonocardia sp. EC080610-09]|uniref:thiolase family protein n=1 Tax=unclassified Pseudonocardia TaxID=2619320 RepID=UPI0006CB6318|nr:MULTISPECIES: thiolase family protein [unclassified Pseudonocardia]ALE75444.1 acetyl-CoA acetyltransferase [Pseudonocardia sp. EC080625-04]ALL74811.1 acetyl-CoA acetyltransferase [Pseudonocardia sp. EC080610-09]ALL81834.1 acetyl-CoA acetyltransferase [Pseudonocardia sp. EC080619-01]
MTPDDTPVVIAARRTPVGTAGGALRGHTVDALAAPVLAALAAEIDTPVDDVLLGNVFGPGGNPARVAALAAGLGETVPGMTVDRQCASGLAAIVAAAGSVRAGDGAAYLAGGAESASTAPARTWPDGTSYTRAPFAPAGSPDPDMGPAADVLAARSGISRERQDAFAARSHARAVDAQRAGRFDGEIVAVGGATADERPRDRFTAERLARFRPAFTADGTHTAANSCGVNDGAAAVLLVSEARRRELGVPGLALEAAATRGCAPELLGLGAVPAIVATQGLRPLRPVPLSGGDPPPGDPAAPDAIEFTEAFAGQVLACVDAAGLDEDRVSPDGGAIALGHPWGASGAVLVVRLFHRLVVQGLGETGLAALSSGGGLGVATRWRVVR